MDCIYKKYGWLSMCFVTISFVCAIGLQTYRNNMLEKEVAFHKEWMIAAQIILEDIEKIIEQNNLQMPELEYRFPPLPGYWKETEQ